jgi:hypothetical protein
MSAPARGLGPQPWLYSPGVDGAFILAPPLLATAAAAWLHGLLGASTVPLWGWVLLVVAVDVSHVYSTLFRTYFDAAELRRRPLLYALTPLACFCVGFTLYARGDLLFWRVLAYLAVFHFVRQAYGFMRLYSRKQQAAPAWCRWVDGAAIYLATLYPLAWWHGHLPRAYDWFVPGDFSPVALPWLAPLTLALYLASLAAFAAKEAWLWRRGFGLNLPRLGLLGGTALSWWVGIVVFNADLAFTVTNIVAHGVPYVALIWVYARKRAQAQPGWRVAGLWDGARFFVPRLLPLFLALLFLMAWVEEGFWDGLVWREHLSAFGSFQSLPALMGTPQLLWVVPLLATPQATHYVLDGFIWKVQGPKADWKDGQGR